MAAIYERLWPLLKRSIFLESDLFLLSLRKSQLRQIQAFESSAARFSRVLGRLEKALDDSTRSLIEPGWQGYNAKIRRELHPRPPMDFLRKEIIMKTVAPMPSRASYFSWYRKFLEGHISRQRLLKLLQENYVGKPLISWPRYRASFPSIQHLFHIVYLAENTRRSLDDVETILEWGGGYGDFAKVILRYLDRQATYVLIDTPLMTAVQWLYLSSILGQESVYLVDDSGKSVRKRTINLVSLPFINNIKEKPSLFVSTWALTESARSAFDLVYSKGWLDSDHVLIAAYKDDLDWTSASGILSEPQRSALKVIEMQHYPNHFYVIR